VRKYLKKDAAVARFVLVFPFVRLLFSLRKTSQVKLDGVDQLPLVAFDHHLVAAEI